MHLISFLPRPSMKPASSNRSLLLLSIWSHFDRFLGYLKPAWAALTCFSKLDLVSSPFICFLPKPLLVAAIIIINRTYDFYPDGNSCLNCYCKIWGYRIFWAKLRAKCIQGISCQLSFKKLIYLSPLRSKRLNWNIKLEHIECSFIPTTSFYISHYSSWLFQFVCQDGKMSYC